MIKNIFVGDILDPENRADIIIAMNIEFRDVQGIGRAFIGKILQTRAIRLGTVISFEYDESRELHMLICHHIGKGGWRDAEQFVRYGMDYLWHSAPRRKYSIVNIGTGRVGIRDGADHAKIREAVVGSFLPVDLYVYNERARIPAEASARSLPVKALRMWDMEHGQVPIQVAA